MGELDLSKEQLAAVEQIVSAWTVPGPVPGYHRMMQQKLHQEWTMLALAIERLAAASR